MPVWLCDSDLRLLHTTIEYSSTQSQLSCGVVPWWVEVESSGRDVGSQSLTQLSRVSRLKRGKVAFWPEREASASPL